MKAHFFKAIAITAILFAYDNMISAQDFEGRLILKSETVDLPEYLKGMSEAMGGTSTLYIKGTHLRMDSGNPQTGVLTVLFDKDKSKTIAYMEVNERKIATIDEVNESNDTGKFVKQEETKTIAGYTCYKGIYMTEERGKTKETEIWYTQEIQNNMVEYPKVPGMPMEYTVKYRDFSIRNQVTEVVAEKLDDSIFQFPDGYEVLNKAEFRRAISEAKNP